MTDFQHRTVSLEQNADARLFSKGLTAMVKHPVSLSDRAAYLEATSRTLHEKAAIGAIVSGTYDVSARRFLAGPAGSRVLSALGGFQVPPYARLQSSPSEPTAEWIAGGNPIPVVRPDFDSVTTESASFGFIVPVSTEVVEMDDERATSAVQQIVAPALIAAEDRKVLGTEAAVAGSNPAGLLATATDFSGGSPSSLETDLEAMAAHVDRAGARWKLIAAPRVALWMALQRTERGARFPDARVDGTGNVAGIPLLVSRAAGNKLILIDTNSLVVVDNGLDVSASQHAAVLMDDSPSSGAAQLLSGFQTDTVFLRFLRRAWWTLLRDDAIAFTTISELANSPN